LDLREPKVIKDVP